MANNLKKVSILDPIDPEQMEATDLFYYVHADDESLKSWSLSLSDLFIGSNNITSDIKFNNDTVYIKSGKVGINGSPDFAQTLQINGSIFVSTYANVSSYLITGGNITSGNDILAKGSIESTYNLTVGGSSVTEGDAYIYGTTRLNSLLSTNVNPRSTYVELINIIYPVGSIYTSTISTNPNTLFGIGTWIAYGEGRVLVGKASTGTFTTPGATGGAETVTLQDYQSGLPAHSHPITDPSHVHSFSDAYFSETPGGSGWLGSHSSDYDNGPVYFTHNTNGATTGISINNNTPRNASEAHTNLQPYVVVYMWRRTA
jgi:microcystin-dependent protein